MIGGSLMAGALLGTLPVAFVYPSFVYPYCVEHDVSGMIGSMRQ
jgi:hypothetical protein